MAQPKYSTNALQTMFSPHPNEHLKRVQLHTANDQHNSLVEYPNAYDPKGHLPKLFLYSLNLSVANSVDSYLSSY